MVGCHFACSWETAVPSPYFCFQLNTNSMKIKLKPVSVSKSPKEYAAFITKDIKASLTSGINLRELQKELEALSLKLGEEILIEFDINISKKKGR